MRDASSGIGAFLDAYRDILPGVRWLLVPLMLVIMSLVMANAISITVRERRTEMAVMKVLGYRPNQILQLVLGEALLVGAASGLVAATATYLVLQSEMGRHPVSHRLLPGLSHPGVRADLGPGDRQHDRVPRQHPAGLTARSVKVSEVFSRVA